MARLAASLVRPGSTVVLDIGTSVAEVARQLALTFQGRVLTNSLVAATELAGREGIELLVAGGRVRGGDLACFGAHAETLFADFYGGTAFLGSGAVHPQIGLTDHYIDEIPSRRIIIDRADEVYVMADASKLGQVAPVKVCEIAQLTAVITDDSINDEVERAFEDAGIRLLVARLSGDRRTRRDPASAA
jgi:DeoR/GlpR family transcriptional regulator of sugar metabolism